MARNHGRSSAERVLVMFMAIAGAVILAFPTSSQAQQQPVGDASSPEVISDAVDLTLSFCLHSWAMFPDLESWGLGETAGVRVNGLEMPLERGDWPCDHTWPHAPPGTLSDRGETPTQQVATDSDVHISWWNHRPDWQHYIDPMGWYCESNGLDLGFFGDDTFVINPRQMGIASNSKIECTLHVVERLTHVALTVATIGDGDTCAADREILIVDNESGRSFTPGILPDSPQLCERVYRGGGLPLADSYSFASPDEGVDERTTVFCGLSTFLHASPPFPRLSNGLPLGKDNNSSTYCGVVIQPRDSSGLYFSDFNGRVYWSYEIARCVSDCPEVLGPESVTDSSAPQPVLEVIETDAGDDGHLLEAGTIYRVRATNPIAEHYNLACREGGTDAWVGTPTPDFQSIYITAPTDGVLACEPVWVGPRSGSSKAATTSDYTSTTSTYGGPTTTSAQYLSGSDAGTSAASVSSLGTVPTVSGNQLPITGTNSSKLAVIALAMTAMGLAYLRSGFSTDERHTDDEDHAGIAPTTPVET